VITGWFSFARTPGEDVLACAVHQASPGPTGPGKAAGLAGPVIPDPQHEERVLQAVGYYGLSGYWYPYRQPSPSGVGRADEFVSGTNLDQIIGLYDFDRRLKLHLLDATPGIGWASPR